MGQKRRQQAPEHFKGVLVTHLNKNNEPTQGTGYYGVINKNQPILDTNSLPSQFIRNEPGTDIFVAGFKDQDDWKEKIVKSVLENFFVAILDERLIVKVEDITINSNNLSVLLERYTKDDPNCLSYSYYEAFTLSIRIYFYEKDFLGLGELELFILTGKNLPKRVAMVRSTGMKIFDKGNFRTPIKFAGVLLAKGEKLNVFLRETEPPTHNKWESDRHEDPDYAKTTLKKINNWINEQVRSISIVDAVEELDVDGLGEYLPDNYEEANMTKNDIEKNFNGSNEGEKGEPKDIEIEFNYRPIKPNQYVSLKEDKGNGFNEIAEGVKELDTDNDSSNQSDGSRDSNDSNDDERDLQSDKTDLNDNRNDKEDEREPASQGNKSLQLAYSRIFCVDPILGIYKISVQVDGEGKGYLGIKIIGEVVGEAASIKSAVVVQTGEVLGISKNAKIGPIGLTPLNWTHTLLISFFHSFLNYSRTDLIGIC